MTPVLSAVYEELVARASAPPLVDRGQQWVDAFLERTGTFPADHPSAPHRLTAAWEDALCRGGLAAHIIGSLADPAERELASLIPRAHQGLFSFQHQAGHHLVHDVLSGAAFVLLPDDSIGREVVGDNLGGLCQGRVVGGSDGCALLPGVVFHEADATENIREVVAGAAREALPQNRLLEGLLRMDHRLRTQSRIRPAHAYRMETLRAGVAGKPIPWRRPNPRR